MDPAAAAARPQPPAVQAPASATAVRFTPLLGVDGRQPLSYMLELDGFTLLLDCGWDDSYDPALLAPLLAALPRVDAVLLSHPDPGHLGALPYLVGRCGLRAPVYATAPVHKMGQMFMYDQCLARQAESDFDAFNLDDVDAAFAAVVPLRYQQDVMLSGKGSGITLTPFAAGHQLGGAVWRVRKAGDDYVYAVDYNHRKERHLNGTVLESAFQRPALLITDSLNALATAPERPHKERELLDSAMATLRGDGSVLLPIDTAGRLLELVLVLERHWAEHRLTYPLVLLSAMAYSTMEFAKSQLEWMNAALVRSLGHARDNPFATRYLKLCTSREELRRLPRGPKLVLATLPSLEAGYARQLFLEWAGDGRNAVVFATAPPPGSLAERVLQLGAQAAQAQAQQQPGRPPGQAQQLAATPTLRLLRSYRVPLQGRELEEHLAAAAAAQAEAEARALAEQQAAEAAAQAAAAAAAAAEQQQMAVDGGGAAGGADSGGRGTAGGGLLSPRATPGVPRVNSLAIGHLRSGGGGGARGQVVGADGLPVEGFQEAAATAACLVEGFEVPKGAARPMFPFEDAWEHEEVDEYGAALDAADFDLQNAAAGFKALEGELAAEAAAEEAPPPPDVPTKVVSESVELPLRARVLRFDFDGRADGRSVRTILQHVAPRHCVLVHGAAEATAALAGYLRTELAGLHTAVYTPQAGEEVELPVEAAYHLALSDALLAGARLHRIGDYRLAWVEGVVGAPALDSESGLPQLLPSADAAAAGGANEGGGYGGVFIGDVKLSDLKQALAAAGIASEFYAGALYCAGAVVIKRRGAGEDGGGAGGGGGGGGLVVEGALSDDYYRIREVVYSQMHVC